jgi:hypothetical protein
MNKIRLFISVYTFPSSLPLDKSPRIFALSGKGADFGKHHLSIAHHCPQIGAATVSDFVAWHSSTAGPVCHR